MSALKKLLNALRNAPHAIRESGGMGTDSNVYVTVRDADGNVKATRAVHNVETNAGIEAIQQLINDGVSDPTDGQFSAIAIGTGTSSFSASSTSLNSEDTRAAASCSQSTTSVTNDTMTLENTFNFSGSKTIAETGVFNNTTSGGVMLCATTFSGVPVEDGDSMTVTWDVQLSAA